MKFIFLLMITLVGTVSTTKTNKELFMEKVDTAYENYVYQEVTTALYDMIIVEGVIGEQHTYGVYFYSESARHFYIRLKENNTIYTPPTNSRGDVEVVAFKLSKEKDYKIEMYDKGNRLQYPQIDLSLEAKTKTAFLSLDGIHTGEGKGISFVSLSKPFSLDIFILLMIFIIIISLFIILIYFKNKKGMFSKEKRMENVYSYREAMEQMLASMQSPNEIGEDDNLEFEVLEEERNFVQDEPVDVTERKIYKRYGRTEEEESGFDIAGHLLSMGLPYHYREANTDEKYQIMQELVKLRDNHDITYDDYLRETMELWKN